MFYMISYQLSRYLGLQTCIASAYRSHQMAVICVTAAVVCIIRTCIMDRSYGKICVVVLLVTLLPAAVLSCEGTRITGEADQQTRIPCTFTGDMRNLYWFYQENEGMERKKVLTYFKQELTYHGNYTSDHVQLDVETSTLVIMSVSIADEGIYTCDVDRLNKTAVLDIVSCLDVFATPSKPFPQITECNAFGQDETCNLFSAETETNITCILSGFYPDGKATLKWLHQDLTPESSVKEDETYILTIRSTVPREGNYSCEASYVLPNGTVTTGRKQIFFKEMEVKTAWSTGQIAGVIVAILTAIIIIIIITIWILWGKRKRKECKQNVENGQDKTTIDAPGSDSNEPSDTEKENLSKKHHLPPKGQPGVGTSTPEESTTDTDVSRRTNAEKQQPEAPEKDSSDLSGTEKEELSVNSPLLTKERLNEGTSSPEERMSDTADISRRKNEEKQEPGDAQGSESNKPLGTEKEKLSVNSPLLTKEQPNEGTSSPEERMSDTADISRRQQKSVTEKQILKLSTILAPRDFNELGVVLGFTLSVLDGIKQKHMLDIKEAFIELLDGWKRKSGGLIHVLDKALVDAKCGGLVKQYKHYSSSE